MAALQKANDALNQEVGALKAKLATTAAVGEMAVAKAQLECARDQYKAVEEALQKGYDRAVKAFSDMKKLTSE